MDLGLLQPKLSPCFPPLSFFPSPCNLGEEEIKRRDEVNFELVETSKGPPGGGEGGVRERWGEIGTFLLTNVRGGGEAGDIYKGNKK